MAHFSLRAAGPRLGLALATLVLGSGIVTALTQVASAAHPTNATVVYGTPDNLVGGSPPRTLPCLDEPSDPTGTPSCFVRGRDATGNALDQVSPRTSVIADDGTITFIRAGGNHRAAVYAPGTDVRALQAAVGAGAGFFDIDTAQFDRLFHGPAPAGWPVSPPGVTTPGGPTGTFSSPGTYLVVCTFRPHFRDFDMYGWVQVQ